MVVRKYGKKFREKPILWQSGRAFYKKPTSTLTLDPEKGRPSTLKKPDPRPSEKNPTLDPRKKPTLVFFNPLFRLNFFSHLPNRGSATKDQGSVSRSRLFVATLLGKKALKKDSQLKYLLNTITII